MDSAGYWLALAKITQQKRASIAIIVVVVAVVAGVGSNAFNPPLTAQMYPYLPRGSTLMKAIDTISTAFNPGMTYPFQVCCSDVRA